MNQRSAYPTSEDLGLDPNVNNALKALKEKSIIIQDDKRRGFYRLPTNSFAAWINAVRSARAKSDGRAEAF